MKGRVKWFNSPKGYGFITGEDNKQYFAHYTKINGDGFKNLMEAQEVQFEVQETPKGPAAVNIEAF